MKLMLIYKYALDHLFVTNSLKSNIVHYRTNDVYVDKSKGKHGIIHTCTCKIPWRKV